MQKNTERRLAASPDRFSAELLRTHRSANRDPTMVDTVSPEDRAATSKNAG